MVCLNSISFISIPLRVFGGSEAQVILTIENTPSTCQTFEEEFNDAVSSNTVLLERISKSIENYNELVRQYSLLIYENEINESWYVTKGISNIHPDKYNVQFEDILGKFLEVEHR